MVKIYQSPPHQTRDGFSLIEAAIVLALIGLVIGGIWAGAASVSENRRINQALSGSQQIIENFRANWKDVSVEQMEASAAHPPYMSEDSSGYANIDGFSYVDWSRVYDPWGNLISSVYATSPWYGGDYFELSFYDLSKSACMKILHAWGAQGVQRRIASVGTAINTYTSFPMVPVAGDCPSSTTNSIGARFSWQ